MTQPMNRQAKRMMAKQGTDKPRTSDKRASSAPKRERTGPVQYYREVMAELKKVAWPTRSEVIHEAGQRGFASLGYQKVHAEYARHAERVLERDHVPGGYKFYVRRYFQLIRPREDVP